MRNLVTTTAVLILGILTGVFAVLWWTQSVERTKLEDEIEALSVQLNEVNSQISVLEGQLLVLQDREQKLANDLSHVTEELRLAQQTIGSLETENTNLSNKVDEEITRAESLQAKLDLLTLPTPIPSEPVNATGILGDRQLASIPINVSALQEVRGEIICRGGCAPYIQDPIGNEIQTFGGIEQSNFSFLAEMDGRHTLVIKNPGPSNKNYEVLYTIFTRFQRENTGQ